MAQGIGPRDSDSEWTTKNRAPSQYATNTARQSDDILVVYLHHPEEVVEVFEDNDIKVQIDQPIILF